MAHLAADLCFLGLTQKHHKNYSSDLPTEIISQIFEAAVSIQAPVTRLHTSLTLSHVDVHWRNIAISTPALWSSLLVDVDRMTSATLSLLLARSGAFPLSLSFRFNKDPIHLLDIAFVHKDRLRELSIECNTDGYMLTVLKHLEQVALPVLRHFETRFTGYDQYPRVKIFQFDAPCLTNVRTNSAMFLCRPSFDSLNVLHLDSPSNAELIRIDTLCNLIAELPRHLLHLVLHLSLRSSEYFPARPATAFPMLRTLAVGARYETSPIITSTMLSLIHAPALECLLLCAPGLNITNVLRNQVPHNHPLPHLHTLALWKYTVPKQTARELIDFFPSVERLVVVKSPVILELLADDNESPPRIWPHLSSVTARAQIGDWDEREGLSQAAGARVSRIPVNFLSLKRQALNKFWDDLTLEIQTSPALIRNAKLMQRGRSRRI
jgi:hypothetical protein